MTSSLDKLVTNITACGKCDACRPKSGRCLKRSVEEGKIVYHNNNYYYLLNMHSVQHTETDNEQLKTHKTIK